MKKRLWIFDFFVDVERKRRSLIDSERELISPVDWERRLMSLVY